MTKIYLIRHAEAEGNLYRRIHGQFESKITPNGRRQIVALEARFADIPVDACYSSDFLRTQTTARAVHVPKGLPLQLDPGFREIGLGIWENKPFGWLDTFEAANMAAFNQDPVHWHVEGSESYEAYTGRFIHAMTRAAEAHPDGTIAIFTHGAVLRGVSMALFPAEKATHCDNTAVSLLCYENGNFSFEFLNDNSHLDPSISTLGRQHWWRNGAKRDLNLWFRPGFTALPGLEPPETFDTAFTAMLGMEPVGILCLSGAGSLDYLGLLPQYRGQNLAIQLLGQAVFYFREQGRERLWFRMPRDNASFSALCQRLDVTISETGDCEMDLRLQSRRNG